MSGEFGTGKTIFVLAIVVGCFAVLWPKIFYPMLTASVKHPTSARQESMGGHARPERPAHLYPEMMHPALREKGRAMPQRTIDKQARPGPMPGIRPPMGGAGGMVPPPQGKGSGAMGIIMPLYTVGIVVFFVYTIMKVLFKKGPDDDKTPKLKDFGLDPEYRKYVFAEEYLDNAEISTRDQMRRQAREESRSRKKVQQDQVPDTKIGKSECDKISTAISGILAELDQFSSELETRQQQKKEELSRMMMMEREKRNNECKHETQQKRDRVSANDTVPMHVPSSSPKFQRETEPEMTLYSNRTSNFDSRSDQYQIQACRKVSSDTSFGIGLDSVMETAAASAANADKKEEVGDITSEEELTSSEALTTTMSEDNSLPTSLQQHLHALQNEDSPISSKGSSPDMEEYEVINKDEDTAHKLRTQRETSSGEPVIDKVKAAESTEVSSQAAQLHTGEEAPSEKENETQKEEKVVKGKERSRSKEPEEKKSSDKANVCEDQGKDSPSCPVDDSSSAKATDPEATLCTPSDSLGAEEGQTDIDSSTSKENVSSDNADSE